MPHKCSAFFFVEVFEWTRGSEPDQYNGGCKDTPTNSWRAVESAGDAATSQSLTARGSPPIWRGRPASDSGHGWKRACPPGAIRHAISKPSRVIKLLMTRLFCDPVRKRRRGLLSKTFQKLSYSEFHENINLQINIYLDNRNQLDNAAFFY
jgi:hypothetical protein